MLRNIIIDDLCGSSSHDRFCLVKLFDLATSVWTLLTFPLTSMCTFLCGFPSDSAPKKHLHVSNEGFGHPIFEPTIEGTLRIERNTRTRQFCTESSRCLFSLHIKRTHMCLYSENKLFLIVEISKWHRVICYVCYALNLMCVDDSRDLTFDICIKC